MILDEAPDRAAPAPETRKRLNTKARRASRDPLSAAFDRVWRFFSSVRVAIVLILVIAVATLAGTTLIQAPGGVAPGTPEYAAWLPRVRPRYGGWTDLLSALQLFTVFTSWWYRGLLAMLAMSTVICSANRWPGISRIVFSPRVRRPDHFFERARVRASIASTVEPASAAQLLRGALGRHHYRVLTEEGPGVIHLYADKHRFARLGTYLTHLSLVLILAGGITSGLMGFSDGQFTIPEGTTRAVGFGTDLSVKAVSFVDEYYPEGAPKDYRSELVLYRNGTEVKRQTIRVNQPMKYQGVRFFQSFFGPAAYLQIRDAADKLVFDDGVALAWKAQGDRPAGSFALPLAGRDLTIYVVGPASGTADPLVSAGEVHLEVYQGVAAAPIAIARVAQGETKEIAGLKATFMRERQFTGLQVSKDPGAPVIWIGSFILVAGLVVTFGFRHRQLWAVARAMPEGGTRLMLAAVVRRDPGFGAEFDALVTRVRTAATVATPTAAKEVAHV